MGAVRAIPVDYATLGVLCVAAWRARAWVRRVDARLAILEADLDTLLLLRKEGGPHAG